MLPTNLLKIAAASSLLCFSGSLIAQVPANDDCTGAIVVFPGTTGPIDTSAATTSSVWPCANGGSDVWFLYVPAATGFATAETCSTTATYDTCIEVIDGSGGCQGLVSLICNDDSCSLQSSVTWAANVNTPYYIRVGGFGGATGMTDLIITQETNFRVFGAAEGTPFTATLGPNGGTIRDNDFLRWNFDDPNNLFTGNFAAIALNLGSGVQPVGVTPGVAGLEILNAGSTPAGFAFIVPPHMIGGSDYLLAVPPGLLQNLGDSLRIQGLVLDLNASPLPATATDNTLTWYSTDCDHSEEFEDLTPGIGQYAAGWSNGGGIREWSANIGGTPSSGTGPSGASQGTGYMYCEASTPAVVGDTFIMDSPIYLASGSPQNLEFDLSLLGTGIGTLEVFVGDGSIAPALLIGTYATNTATDWETQTIALPTQANYQFRFTYTHAGSFSGDAAIDKICVK